MKTQISNLINGQKNVRRNVNHPKYVSASTATSHVGFAGTPQVERNKVAQQVIDENNAVLNIEIAGIKLNLNAQRSLSQKTVSYNCSITEDQYSIITGHNADYTYQAKFELCINQDMTICVYKYIRKSDNHVWKQSLCDNIGEEFVTIL